MLKIKKIISMSLIIFILAALFPTAVEADQSPVNDTSTSTTSSSTTTTKKKKIAKITKELVNKRTENSKAFQKDDGTYEVDEYQTPVHYLENGQWKDIDNTLQDSTDSGYLENKQNDFKIEIAKNANTQKLVDIKKGNYEVSWNLDNANSAQDSIGVSNSTELNNEIYTDADNEIKNDSVLSNESDADKQAAKDIIESNERTKALSNLSSNVKFSNVFSNTDLQYILNGSYVKENLIINKDSDNIEYKFNLNVKNLTPVIQQDKSIVFYDSSDKTKEVFKIAAPLMYDNAGKTSNDIDVEITKTDSGYELDLTPNKDWLNDASRDYPVTIDPSMETSLDSNSIHDTFVASNDSSNKWLNQYVRVGQTPTIGTTRTYIKFDLPQLATGDMITSATLQLRYASGISSNSSSNQINVHNVTQNFDPTNISWATQPSYDSTIEDYNLIGDSSEDYWEQWDVTSIAKKWFTTGNNYGLMLEDDNSGGYSAFYSSDIDNSIAWARPQISFTYVNNSGLEDYWTYHSQDVGRAGTSYLNDYNGNLVFTHSDIDMSASRMPISINHVFNSNDKGTDIGTGNGWRLNANQRLESETISGTNYYKYTDEDGTEHYFKDTGGSTISDELNLGLTLNKESDGTISISDKKSNKIDFNASTDDLNYIKDANGNTMTFSYGTGNFNGVRNLTKVTDGTGKSVSLNYTNSLLTSIVDTSNRTTYYNYDGSGNLTSITDPDGKTTTYSYDSNHNLVSATNYDGYKISYQYYGIAPYRVSDILESNTNGTLGDELGVSYGNNTTTFTDEKGRKNVYEFDNSGKTICIKDSDGSAQYYQYGDTTNSTKLTSESKLQKTVVNLLTNHDVETSDTSWTSGSDGGNGTSGYSKDTSYLGNQSIKINKTDNVSRQYMSQWLTLQKGQTYTFSAYVKTDGISNTNGQGATIGVYYKNSAGVYQCKETQGINGTKDWQRIQHTFTVPSDAADGSVCIRVNLLQETGTAYFDSMQLETGSIANRYNLIDNGDLSGTSGTPNKWNPVNTSGSDGLTTVNDADHPSSLDNSVYKVSGVYGVEKRLEQSVYVSGKAGDIYSLGSWGKAYSVPNGVFAIQAAFITSSGAQWVTLNFNNDCNDWQYVSGECIANSDYSRIDIYYLYKNNANTAYFDGAQLYKEEFGDSYQYDSNGNIESTASIANQNSNFQYDSNNNLIQSVDAKGNSFTYTYDNNHNITSATSAENVNYGFTYDSYGNPLTSKIGNSASYIQSSATYSSSGDYIKSLTDSLGNTVNYNYDETKGLLTSVTDANGNTTTNSYDNMDRLTSTSATVGGQQVTNSYAYLNDEISQITHNGFSYNFGYDSLGNNTTVAVGNQNLITNNYEPRTSLLLQSTYGNGEVVSNSYDDLDRVSSKSYNGNTEDTYEYDGDGNLGYKQDLVNGVNYTYTYDNADRLVKNADSNGNSTTYQYDLNENISSVIENVNNKGYITSYGYDKDNKQTQVSYTRSNSNAELFPLTGTEYGSNGTRPIGSNVKTAITGTITTKNVTSEGYDVVVTVTSAQGGVSNVQFPTWTVANNQKDIIWGTSTSVSGDTYTYHVNRSNYNNDYGSYITNVYVTDGTGNRQCIGGTSANLVSAPSAITAKIKNVDCNGYDVVATVTSAQGGVSKVVFPTWTTNNGQDDIIWGTPTSVSGNTYTYHVNRSDHKNEYGNYETDVYLYDKNGGITGTCTNTNVNATSLGITASIKNVTSNGYDVVATVTPDASGISKVQFPTWTSNKGQDDIIWGTPTSVSGDTYTYHVNRSDHKNEYGDYETDVYVYDNSGNQAETPTKTTIYAPVDGIDMTNDSGKTVMLADNIGKAVYNLGINKNAGTMSTSFETNTTGIMRDVIAAQGSNTAGLYLYLGTDDKLRVAIRSNEGNLVDLATTNETISANQWYFTAVNWQVENGTLSVTLYLNSNSYTGSTTDFEDFSGANVSLGASETDNVPLDGEMQQFTYSSTAMSSADIQNVSVGTSNNVVNYNYDSLARLSNETINTGTATNTVSYTYVSGTGGNGSTSSKVASISNNGSQIAYTYDANENIKTITQNGQVITYTYNELNELTREDNQVLNESIVYNYDTGGNITSKSVYTYTTGTLGTATSTINYSYGDSNWKDKLTSYNGQAITYDAIGNPLNDGTYTYTWEEGRQLATLTGNGKTISYKYNDDGIRTQKTVNGVTTNYHLEGDNVTYESDGTNSIYYTYDSADKLISMNLNGAEYYYIYNAQGDIIGLFDKTGTQVVSYTYDTWGKLISITGSLKDTVGVLNPYRYRGYRYDTETGMYYLQSRYYNPDWGRFINADEITATTGELLSGNMFAYCKNNPANMSDEDGDRPSFIGETASDVELSVAKTQQMLTGRSVTAKPVVHTKSASFNYISSAVSNIGTATKDKAGSKVASEVVSVSKKLENGALATCKYVDEPAIGEVIRTKALGSVGSILGTASNVFTSIIHKQYFGACMDLLSGAAGIGAGMIFESIGVGIVATFAAPEIIVGAGVFAAGVGACMLFDYADYIIKRKHYGGN
jgi:RHS repeat-associated protein